MKAVRVSLIVWAALAAPALADRIQVQAPPSHVTLYPDGASVTRIVQVELPEGAHQLVLPGLPPGTDPASLRIIAEGARLGAVALQQGRALPDGTPDSPAVQAARDALRQAEAVLRERDAATATIRAEAEAAGDAIDFLRDLAGAEGAASGDVAVLVQSVEARILDARRRAIAAETAARESMQGREDLVRALDDARARLEAVLAPDARRETLLLTVQASGGPARIGITGLTHAAGWQPVYDLRLDRAAGTLALDRGALVSQGSGEDWGDVTLTLSTARPSGQSAPSEVWPEITRIFPDQPLRQMTADATAERIEGFAMGKAAPAVLEEAQTDRLGLTVIYDYPAPVTIRDGVDALRLALKDATLTPEIHAEAVPRFDSSAYLVAEGQNTLGEPILPGRATLYADGAMVGQADVPLIAAGDDWQFGFGALDGVQLERRIPQREEGDRGLIRKSNSSDETALLIIRNLTDQDWPLRVIDRVPVSEQEDLVIGWQATPEPTTQDPDGKRGVLIWDSQIAAGAEQQIELITSLRWPEGMELFR